MNTKKSYGFGGMKIDTLYADNTAQGLPSSLNAQMYQRQNQTSDSQAFEPKIASNFAKSLTTELVKNESGGNYNAEPRDKKTGKLLSSATGKYQFLWNTWKNEIKKVTGIDNKEEFKGNPQAQDKFYNDYYLPNKLMPAVQRLKRQYDTDLSDKQLGLLYHFRGEGGAGAYLQGKVIDKPESYNKPISAYIGKFAFGGGIPIKQTTDATKVKQRITAKKGYPDISNKSVLKDMDSGSYKETHKTSEKVLDALANPIEALKQLTTTGKIPNNMSKGSSSPADIILGEPGQIIKSGIHLIKGALNPSETITTGVLGTASALNKQFNGNGLIDQAGRDYSDKLIEGLSDIAQVIPASKLATPLVKKGIDNVGNIPVDKIKVLDNYLGKPRVYPHKLEDSGASFLRGDSSYPSFLPVGRKGTVPISRKINELDKRVNVLSKNYDLITDRDALLDGSFGKYKLKMQHAEKEKERLTKLRGKEALYDTKVFTRKFEPSLDNLKQTYRGFGYNTEDELTQFATKVPPTPKGGAYNGRGIYSSGVGQEASGYGINSFNSGNTNKAVRVRIKNTNSKANTVEDYYNEGHPAHEPVQLTSEQYARLEKHPNSKSFLDPTSKTATIPKYGLNEFDGIHNGYAKELNEILKEKGKTYVTSGEHKIILDDLDASAIVEKKPLKQDENFRMVFRRKYEKTASNYYIPKDRYGTVQTTEKKYPIDNLKSLSDKVIDRKTTKNVMDEIDKDLLEEAKKSNKTYSYVTDQWDEEKLLLKTNNIKHNAKVYGSIGLAGAIGYNTFTPYYKKEEDAKYDEKKELARRRKLAKDNGIIFAYGGNVKKHGFGNFLSNNTSAVGSGLGFISSGINSMNTTDNPNMALSGVSGALSGAAAGAAFGPIGMGVGALVGGVGSLFGADAQRKQYQEAMRKKNMAEMNTLKQNSESVLSTYNSKGITGKYGYFAEGGETNENNQVYEVEGKEVVQGQLINIPNAKQIANDMVVVKGARHEEGGVKGQGGERVFSDRLFVPNEFHEILEKTGFKPKEDSTFAAVAQLLGKHKGEAEIKSKTFDFIKANTAKLNLQKTTGLIDTLFMIQEGLKEKHPELVKPIFGYGGTIKMAFGGYGANNVPKPKSKRKAPTLFLDTTQQAFKSKIARIDGEEGQADYKPEVLPNPLGFLSPIATPKNAWGDSTIMPAISKKIAPTNLPTIPTINPTYIEPMKGKKHGGRGLGIGDGINALLDNIRNNPESVDYATAGIGYLNDLKTINSMNTTAPRRLQQAVDLNYNDRSGIAIANNRADFRNYVASNFNNGVGNQQAYVNTLKANNNVYSNENERRDNAIDNNRRLNLQINAGNLSTMQQADEREIGLKNEQISQRGQAFNSLLGNITSIRGQANERQLDKDRLTLLRDTYNIKGNGSIDYRINELRKKRDNGTISANELRILNTFDN